MEKDHPLHEELYEAIESIAQHVDKIAEAKGIAEDGINPIMYVEALLVAAVRLIQEPIAQAAEEGNLSLEEKQDTVELLMHAEAIKEGMDTMFDNLANDGIPTIAVAMGVIGGILPNIHGFNHMVYDEEHGIAQENDTHGHNTESGELKDILKSFLDRD